MASISMLSAITRGGATSCCSVVTQTPAAGGLCNAASDWVGSCVTTVKRRRDQPTGLRDEMGYANKANRVRPADRSGDRGTPRVSACRGRPRKSDGFLHFRRLHLRGALGAERHHALGLAPLLLGPPARQPIPKLP